MQERSLVVHGQKTPQGLLQEHGVIKFFPSCVHAREEHRYCCNKAKPQRKVLLCKSEVMRVISPASRKTQKSTEEPVHLEGAPSFIFNNQREAEHGRSDLC